MNSEWRVKTRELLLMTPHSLGTLAIDYHLRNTGDSLRKKGNPGLIPFIADGNPSKPLILRVVGEAGIEPTTPGLEGRCSIRLSYSPAFFHSSVEPAPAGQSGGRTAWTKMRSAVASVEAASIRVDPQAVKYAVIPRSWRPGEMIARRMTRSARQPRKAARWMSAQIALAAEMALSGVSHW